jgi:hypothetical protein
MTDRAEPGLREAAQAVLVEWDQQVASGAWMMVLPIPALRAALAATEPDGLDVDRLARAIEGHRHSGKSGDVIIACGRGHVEVCADTIAAEYARLASATGEGAE